MNNEKKTYGPIFRFVNYSVYQDSKQWFQEINTLKGVFSDHPELWKTLSSNMMAVLMQITASSTKLPQEAKRYLSYAIASANKVVACLDIARDLQVMNDDEFETLSEGYKTIIIQLKGFIKAIGNTKPTVQQQAAQPVAA